MGTGIQNTHALSGLRRQDLQPLCTMVCSLHIAAMLPATSMRHGKLQHATHVFAISGPRTLFSAFLSSHCALHTMLFFSMPPSVWRPLLPPTKAYLVSEHTRRSSLCCSYSAHLEFPRTQCARRKQPPISDHLRALRIAASVHCHSRSAASLARSGCPAASLSALQRAGCAPANGPKTSSSGWTRATVR